MANKLNPYLTFGGNARQAMEFYKSVYGGELSLQSFKDAKAETTPNHENMIMHGSLITPEGMTIMGSDDPEGQSYKSSIAVIGENEAELRVYWDKLEDGATILAPFATAPWGDTFGMLTDKFGIRWLINVTKAKA